VTYALYITHPEVILEPGEPPSRWHLSPRGRERSTAFARTAAMRPIRLLIASPETKTMEMAALLGESGAEIVVGEGTHENVRTSTGILPASEFEAALDALYANPDVSIHGWETLAATEARIIAAVDAALARHAGRGPLAFVGQGTVGTLLKCHLARRPATRDEDQRRMASPGGGNVFAFSLPDKRLLSDWVAMEDFTGVPGAA
jgi:broad specificity phosphatase PhoE